MRERKPRHDDAHRPIKVRSGFVRTDAVLVTPAFTPQCHICGHWHAVEVVCRPSEATERGGDGK